MRHHAQNERRSGVVFRRVSIRTQMVSPKRRSVDGDRSLFPRTIRLEKSSVMRLTKLVADLPELNQVVNAARRVMVSTMQSIVVLLVSLWWTCGSAHGGVSAENVVVVVNANSGDSRTIANHYVELRGIPVGNVIFLDDVPEGLKISLADFKSRILKPLLQQINQRGIAAQTRVIAYSAGFPTGVDISEHTARLTDDMQKRYQTPLASLNSLTYFYRFVLSDDTGYLSWYSNLYARSKFERYFINPFAGEKGENFNSAKLAMEQGRPADAGMGYRDLFIKYPSLAPLGILAAEAFIQADDQASATQMLAAALRSGWTSIEYLRDSESLAPLVEKSLVQKEIANTRDYPTTVQYPMGFASTVGWTSAGCPVKSDEGGMPYLLSCSLAVVHANASTVDQAVAVLERSAKCDRTFPQADVRFSKTNDVRTTTRLPGVTDALIWLGNRDVKTEVFASPLSTSPGKCVGMMLGTATLNLSQPAFEFVPGAIAENLTSLGGAFETPQQTKLTDLLHAGVAMSSGAVAEPYSLQPKFPLPLLYPYYLEGMSAIESFYSTTTSPYQLLIVGDPLAQPYARGSGDFVTITPDANDPRHIVVSRQSIVGLDPAKYSPTVAMEVFLAGRLAAEFKPQSKIDFNISGELDGEFEVRVVLVSDPILQVRVSKSGSVALTTSDVTADVQSTSRRKVKIRVGCPGAERVALYHHGVELQAADAESATFELSRDQLGEGPLRLVPVAKRGSRQIQGKSILVQ